MLFESTLFLVLQIAVLQDRTKQNPGAPRLFNVLSLFFGAIMGLYGLIVTYGRVASYYTDVCIGHQKFTQLPLEVRESVISFFPREKIILSDANWWYWLFIVFAGIEFLVLMKAIATLYEFK